MDVFMEAPIEEGAADGIMMIAAIGDREEAWPPAVADHGRAAQEGEDPLMMIAAIGDREAAPPRRPEKNLSLIHI